MTHWLRKIEDGEKVYVKPALNEPFQKILSSTNVLVCPERVMQSLKEILMHFLEN